MHPRILLSALCWSLCLPALSYGQQAAHPPPVEIPPQPPTLVPDRGKLLLTAGFSDVEGAGGAGLVPWAVISGYGSRDSWGANAHLTDIRLRDFDLRTYGVALGVFDRVEVSATRHELDVTGTALRGLEVSQDIFGVKLRVAGDAVYGQNTWLPQIAVGAQIKRHGGIDNGGALTSPMQLGARDDDGVDYYVAGTKIFLDKSLVLNLTLRHSKANQLGLLGFGGDQDAGANLGIETSVGYLLTRKLAVGGEYRGKSDHLGVDQEGDAWDVFVAWTPNRHVSLVAAYVNLGNILGPATTVNRDQAGTYLSVQVGF
jgi:Protein of unknown function (DUF3034)